MNSKFLLPLLTEKDNLLPKKSFPVLDFSSGYPTVKISNPDTHGIFESANFHSNRVPIDNKFVRSVQYCSTKRMNHYLKITVLFCTIFRISRVQKPWTVAQKICNDHGGRLFEPWSYDQNQWCTSSMIFSGQGRESLLCLQISESYWCSLELISFNIFRCLFSCNMKLWSWKISQPWWP